MATLTCGSGGSTGGEIVDQINTNTTGVEDHEVRITALEWVDPVAIMGLSADITVTLTDDPAPTILPVFDTILVSRGGFVADNTAYTISSSIDTSLTRISMGFNVEFSGNQIMEMQLYVNGSPYYGANFYLKGDGTNKPIAFFWQSIVTTTDGDVFDIRARNDATGSFNAIFKHAHFAAETTIKEVL